MAEDNIWVIIPAYNEGKRILSVINKAKKYTKNIVVVDDGSSDNSYEVAKAANIIALKHIVNIGKGAALKTGCDYAVKAGAKILIVMDADGQHNPKDIPRFIGALKNKDIVFGARGSKNMPLVMKLGNWFINNSTRLLYGTRLRDTQGGFRAFTKEAYKKIRWSSTDYSMESEMIANAGKHNLKYKEIEIKTVYSDKFKGTTVLDGTKIVLNMLWWKIRR